MGESIPSVQRSVKFPTRMWDQLGEVAKSRKMPIADLIREGAALVLESEDAQRVLAEKGMNEISTKVDRGSYRGKKTVSKD